MKNKTLSCRCGSPQCGRLKIIDIGKTETQDGQQPCIEFNFIPYKHKKVNCGVIVKVKDIKDFISALPDSL